MAKYERRLTGSFAELVQLCDGIVMRGSVTAERVGESDYASAHIRVAVRIYDRYSAFGGSRVSLTLTLVGEGEQVFLSAITAGGSKAMFFKLDTVGEEAFLKSLMKGIEQHYPADRR